VGPSSVGLGFLPRLLVEEVGPESCRPSLAAVAGSF